MIPPHTASILDRIVARKREEVARLPGGPVSPEELQAAVQEHGPRRDFAGALRRPRRGSIALIAEVKKASPSAGVIRPDFDPVSIAREYEAAGATCLSILTDAPFFQGQLSYLRAVRAAVNLPLLRKDFLLDSRQLREAVEWGADAVLLIAAILSAEQLQQLHALARSAGLAVLVEVHDEEELETALGAGANLIGVNNRDLRTFQVDLATTERLAGRLAMHFPNAAQRPLLVAESGIHTRADVERVQAAGADAILVGESLMRSPDLRAQMRALLGD
ncbi:indole-3-glycerol phosphate synthase TrpC [Limisphaera sp. VF-2]|jgi:indole-3-glycerol phosphate synthase|uniref:indole-3-glycerol phosphate synthase TrpC n=1 Tax=Limisphaera sp. VF-2 TaxID=3400418 RepID=UPI001778BECA